MILGYRRALTHITVSSALIKFLPTTAYNPFNSPKSLGFPPYRILCCWGDEDADTGININNNNMHSDHQTQDEKTKHWIHQILFQPGGVWKALVTNGEDEKDRAISTSNQLSDQHDFKFIKYSRAWNK